jgi:hypothetical protein
MANAFFNDTLAPFEGVDIGWGQDPNFPIGEYSVVVDLPTEGIMRQFALYQDEDENIRMTEGTLMDTYRADDNTVVFDDSGVKEDQPLSSWYMLGTPLGGNDEDPVIAIKVDSGKSYGFWLEFKHGSTSVNSAGASRLGDVGMLQLDTYGGVKLVESEEHLYATHAEDFVNAEVDKSYIFLAHVAVTTVDGHKVATIYQKTFGPIYPPVITYIGEVRSKETPNRLVVDPVDRGLRTSKIAKEDSNDIYEDGNGQLYLRIQGGADITIEREEDEDDEVGKPTIRVTEASSDSWDAKANAAVPPSNDDHQHP